MHSISFINNAKYYLKKWELHTQNATQLIVKQNNNANMSMFTYPINQ